MGRVLSVGVVNAQPEATELLRQVVTDNGGLKLVLEAEAVTELESALLDGTLDLVVVNLDEDVEFGYRTVQHILRSVPDMSIIGVSKQTDPMTIISAMRAGCTQFVCAPMDPEDFRSAVERIRATRLHAPPKSQRICVVGAAGGVGTTTLSCNLAMEIAHVTQQTSALVDLVLEYGDAAFAFDCEPKFSIADLCRSGSPVDRTMLESALHPLPCNVSLLSRPADVADARIVTPEGVEQTLTVLGTMFPCVVVDLPRMFSFLSAAALDGADLVLIVAQLSVPSVRNASRLYDLLLQMGAQENAIQIVLNRCRADHQRVTPDDVKDHFRRPVFAMIPNDYRRVAAALDFGHPIMADSPDSPARMAIHDLATRIANSQGLAREEKKPTKGRLRRWLGGQSAPAPDARA